MLFVAQGTFAVANRNAATTQTSWSPSGLLGVLSAVGLLLFPIVGFILARKVPRNWIGWIMLLIGVSIAVPLDGYAQYALLTRHGALPFGRIAEAISGPFWVPLIMLAGVFLVLLFPDGHVPPGWRWFAWSAGAVMAFAMFVVLTSPGPFETLPTFTNPFGISWVEPFQLLILLIPLSIVGAAISMIQRYRRSTGIERLQLKWLAAAVSIVAVTYLIVEPLSAIVGFNTQTAWLSALQAFALFTFGLIPVAIGFAVLRYRLYEIDVVINRAVLFGSMAVFITAVYVGIVVGVGAFVGSAGLSARCRPSAAADRGDRVPAGAAPGAALRRPAGLRETRHAVRGALGVLRTPGRRLRRRGSAAPHGTDPRRGDRRRTRGRVAEGGRPAPPGRGLADRSAGARRAAIDAAPGLVPVRHQGEMLGALSIDKRPGEQVSPTEERLIADLASQAGLVLRNAALIADLRSSRQRLVAAQDEERRKIERNLHDGAQQQLVALAVQLKLARTLVDRDPARAGADAGRAPGIGDERAGGPARPRARDLSAAAGRQGTGRGARRPGAQGRRRR